MGPIAAVTSEAAFALGVALLIIILLRRGSRYLRRARREQDSPVRPPKHRGSTSVDTPSAPIPLLDAPPDAVRWRVEMHEVARDMTGELNTKMAALQSLIGMARQESQRLEELLARCRQMTGEQAMPDCDPLDKLARGEALSDADMPVRSALDAAQRTRLYALADQGLPPAAIADELGLSLGDTELHLSLRTRG